MKTSSIHTENLTIGYTLRNSAMKIVHKNLNLSLNEGELTCLLGLNGAGKSTLLRTLSGAQKPLSGKVYWRGKDILSYTESERSLIVGVVLTEKVVVGNLSVYEMVGLGRYPYTGFFGHLKEEDHRAIRKALTFVGINDMGDRNFSELSDGEKQKVMIAKVLAQECPVIILDEPTAFLDINSRIETIALLQRLTRIGKTVLMSTHDLDIAMQMGDRLWLLDQQKDFVSGIPEDLVLNGIFYNYFAKEGVVFDSETGRMRLKQLPFEPVYLSTDKTTTYWINNALNKNGFSLIDSPEKCKIRLCRKAPSQIDIYYQDKYLYSAYSVEELIRKLILVKSLIFSNKTSSAI